MRRAVRCTAVLSDFFLFIILIVAQGRPKRYSVSLLQYNITMASTESSKRRGGENGEKSNRRTGPGQPPPQQDPSSNAKKKLKALSHSLSWVLRHKAVELGFTMSSDGYVPVDEILNSIHPKFRTVDGPRYTVDDIRNVVEACEKQRYKLEERPASSYSSNGSAHNTEKSSGSASIVLCIRANQGHSIALVDPSLLLKLLTPAELASLPMIVHGTSFAAWESIQGEGGGLHRMTRNHIHFATGLPNKKKNDDDDETATSVLSGMRKNCEVYIYVDAAMCSNDGVTFYRSDNGVLLTAGVNDEGTLPVEYFSHVTDASGNVLMMMQQQQSDEKVAD